VSSLCSNAEVDEFREARVERSEGVRRGLRAGVLLVVERDASVIVADRDQTPVESSLGDGGGGPVLALQAERVDLDTRVAVERGDQVGGEALRDLWVDGE
jgi:hypothetical protein